MNFRREFEVDLLKNLLIQAFEIPQKPIERRAYYDDQGHIITYTCEDLPGNYIVVTPEQFAEARPDAVVKEGKLIYTHKLSHVTKLVQSDDGVSTSKYDINILLEPGPDSVYWQQKIFEASNDESADPGL